MTRTLVVTDVVTTVLPLYAAWDDGAMADLSTSEPVVKWSEQWWAKAKPEVHAHRCIAHRKNGDRCKRAAINGGRVYTHHGGNAPAVKAKARQRLEDAADRMARELLKMTVDENVSDAVKLAAIRDALDRAGLSARTAVSVEVGPRPFEVVFDDIASGSRAESRAHRGMPDDDGLDAIGSTRTMTLFVAMHIRSWMLKSSSPSPTAPTYRRGLTLSGIAPTIGHTPSVISSSQNRHRVASPWQPAAFTYGADSSPRPAARGGS